MKKCLCCGKNGHLKKECRLKDTVCKNCGKVGHVAQICHNDQKAKADPPTYAEAVQRTKLIEATGYIWKCLDLNCKQWMHSEKSSKCTSCSLPRPKESKPEQFNLEERDLMKLPKATAEAIERLTTEEEDELMGYPLPAAEQEL